MATPAPTQTPQAAPQSPAQQAAVRVTFAAMKTIYDQKILPHLLQIMRSGDPAEGLAKAVLFVMKGLFEASKGTLPTPAFLPAVQMVMPLIAELGEAAGIAKADEALVRKAAEIFMQLLKAESSRGQPAAPGAGVQPPSMPPPQGRGLLQSAMRV